MKYINFKKIWMENYTLFIDPMELSFNNNLLLITGPNGSGKTSAIDCIPYTIYGVTSKGAHGDDLVNDQIEKNCHTQLLFDVDNDTYKLDRYHKHSKFGNNALLFKNDEESPFKSGHTDVVKEMEKLLIPKNLFMNMLYFGQKVKDFFTDLTDTKKKEIFSKILDLEVFKLYYAEVVSRLKSVVDQITKNKSKFDTDTEILKNVLTNIIQLEESKERFGKSKKQEIKNYSGQIVELEKEYSNLDENYLIYGSQLKNKLKQVEELSVIDIKIRELDSKIIEFKNNLEKQKVSKEKDLREKERKNQEEINKRYNVIESLDVELSSAKEKMQDIIMQVTTNINKMNLDQTNIQNNITRIKKERDEIIEDVINKEISVCPTCKQEINEITKANLKKVIDKSNIEIQSLRDQFENNIEKLKELNVNLKNNEKEIEKINNDFKNKKEEIINEKEKQLTESGKKLDDILKKLDNLAEDEFKKYKVQMGEEVKNYKIQKEEYDKVIEEKNKIEEKSSKVHENLLSIDSQINVMKKELVKKEEDIFDNTVLEMARSKVGEIHLNLEKFDDEIISLEKKKKILEFWKIGFSSSGIPALLIDDAIPFMNKRSGEYLEKLSSGRYILSFDTTKETKGGDQRDKIAVRVVDNKTKANATIKLSGGQMRLIDISTILTLHDLYTNFHDVKFNLLLFDEIFDALDDENINNVSSLLRELTKDKTIGVISHLHINSLEYDEIDNF